MAWIYGIFRRLCRCFVTGVLALLPIMITVAVIVWVAGTLHSFLGPDTVIGGVIQKLGLRVLPGTTSAYLCGTLAVLACFLVVGVLAEAGARAFIQKIVDLCVRRIPIVGSVYGTSKQLVDMIDRQKEGPDGDATKSMTAVYCSFGGEHAVNVLGLLVSPQRYLVGEREHLIVIIPTAPVPVGGGLFFMPVDSVKEAGISAEALMSIYVSMGITAPQFVRMASTAPQPISEKP
ncbi:MAG: DUF502 domain-containing protein [Planctomycetia bacterium]|nr:DUF502 domain-containing protein [Planctomycetia bacterium]